MEELKNIGNNFQNSLLDLYKKPVNAYKDDGMKGSLKGFGSALGGVVETVFVTPIDLVSLGYNELSKKKSEKDEEKINLEDTNWVSDDE